MLSPRSRFALSLVVLLVLAGRSANADLRKLDPRARVTLAKLRAGAVVAEIRGRGMAVDAQGDLDVFIRGSVSRRELEAAGAEVRTALPGIYTAYVPAGAIEAVAALPGVQSIRGAVPCEAELDVSVPTTGANLLRGPGPTFTGVAGQGVLIGDVDSGVDYNHGDFDDASGNTRLVKIWDQTTSGTPPINFGYGAEWSSAQINSNACTETDDLNASSHGHGTHVLGIAGGDGSQTGGTVPAFTYVGMAPKADLVMVKTGFMNSQILDGVNYVFDLATARGQNAVCNLSLGSQFGPHDGTDDFESGLSALTGPGRIIVKSGGNDRGSGIHADVLAAGAGTNATMTVGSTTTLFAIDGYYESTENIKVKITTPNNTVIGPVSLGGINAGYPGTSTANGTVYLENGASVTSTNDPEVYVEVNVGSGQNAGGTWTFTFIPVALGAANGEVDLWRFYVLPNGTTAAFVTGASNQELVSEPGNAVDLITAAAWVSRQNWVCCNGTNSTFTGTPAAGNLAGFSSPGPTRDGRQKPDIAAPGVAIGSALTLDGVSSCPVSGASNLLRDGPQHFVNAGTSMAAPHVSGAAALLLQVRGALTPAEVKAYLASHATVDAFTGAVWNRDWGNGKLYLGDLVAPTAHVTSPNGGENYLIGTSTNLTWSASDALGGVTNVDLRLSRSGPSGPFENIALAIPNSGSYAWTVTGPPTGVNAYLKVTAHDANGNAGSDLSDAPFHIHGAAAVSEVVTDFALSRVTPNPTPGVASFEIALPREARIKVAVLDVQGREVAVLARGVYRAGRYVLAWNGKRAGRAATSGLYLVRYETAERSFVRRVVIAR